MLKAVCSCNGEAMGWFFFFLHAHQERHQQPRETRDERRISRAAAVSSCREKDALGSRKGRARLRKGAERAAAATPADTGDRQRDARRLSAPREASPCKTQEGRHTRSRTAEFLNEERAMSRYTVRKSAQGRTKRKEEAVDNVEVKRSQMTSSIGCKGEKPS
ncbi:hypothetical protein cyc_07701 [Cyclospora cayetanensis]|uniref:Uncharacterized protein n=1 Tax=Cyclospora cayetanensis TaxID=88456 RepID=A0A1D3D8E8_9EIME|nr:hypothetical protein cyc_07701 [Cyclospora cayetanensis]